jgi:hypothetical protein
MLRVTFEVSEGQNGRPPSAAGSGQRRSVAVLLGYGLGKMIPGRIVLH